MAHGSLPLVAPRSLVPRFSLCSNLVAHGLTPIVPTSSAVPMAIPMNTITFTIEVPENEPTPQTP